MAKGVNPFAKKEAGKGKENPFAKGKGRKGTKGQKPKVKKLIRYVNKDIKKDEEEIGMNKEIVGALSSK